MTVTIYTKPACMQCNATHRAVDKAGIDYTTVDTTVDITEAPTPASISSPSATSKPPSSSQVTSTGPDIARTASAD